jgi:hypothetical protein
MRTLQKPLFVVFAGASVAVMLAGSLPAQAQQWHRHGFEDDWRRRSDEGAERRWREHEWREQQWRASREWAWRNQPQLGVPYWSYQYQPYGYGWPRW